LATVTITLPAEERLTVVQLAAALRVGIQTIHRYHKDGVLPPPVEGMPYLCWRPEDIQAWALTRLPGNWRFPKPAEECPR
jgi:predicted DNA-binding transcriptional regulator AlpA